MDEKSKKQKFLITLIAIVVVMIILIIAIILLNLTKIKENENINNINQIGEDFAESYGKEENKGIDKQSYYDVNDCIKQYLATINIKSDSYYGYDEEGNYVLIIDENRIKQKIYDLLSSSFIKEKNITIDNLYENIKTIESSQLFVPLEIKLIQDEDIKSFLVHGITEKQDNFEKVDDVFFIVNIDISTNLFSIEPIYDKYKNIDEIKINKFETAIKQNNENKFVQTIATYEETAKEYINLYKRLALGVPEQMYNMLDKEYREAKFGNIEQFKKYVDQNKQKITGIKVEKYQAKDEINYTQYVCIDQNNNYYIFRETSVMDYTVILDTYTIDLPEFIEKYNAAKDEEKVLLNIQKCFEAINNKDYSYVYNKLDETFKANNFKTLQNFENYIKKNTFESNSIGSSNGRLQGNVYMYDITISDKTGKNTNTIKKTFVMQLKEGTEFVMSFGV